MVIMVDVQRINIKVCSDSIKSLRIRRFSFQIVRLTSFMSLLLPLLSASSWEDTKSKLLLLDLNIVSTRWHHITCSSNR